MSRWVPVPGWGRYQVSDGGHVRRVLSPGVFRPLRGAPNSKGYFKVTLCAGPRRWQVYVHQLVMLAFGGPCPAGHEVDHKDFVKANNARSNLRYMPAGDNRWRWSPGWCEEETDPAERVRIDALYAEWEGRAVASGW